MRETGNAARSVSTVKSRAILIAAGLAAVGVVGSQAFAAAAVFTYTSGSTSNTSPGDLWSAGGTAWGNQVPASGIDNSLVFNVPTGTNTTRYTKDDLSTSPFQVNNLTFQGAGTASTTDTLNVLGNQINMVSSSSSAAPTIALNATKGTTTVVNVQNDLSLDANTTFTGAGNATYVFSGNIGGTGTLIKGNSSSDSASLILTGDVSNAATVTGGTLQIGNNGSTGSIAGDITVNTTASNALVFKRSDVYTYSGKIIGGISGARVTQAGSGTLVLTGTNTFTGPFSVSGTLQGADSTVYTTATANVRTVLGNNALLSVGNNSTTQLRANGNDDAGLQVLTFTNSIQGSGIAAFTVDVDRQAATGGTGKVLAISGSTAVSTNAVMNITGDHGFSLQLAALTVGGGATTGNLTLNPTTANVTVAGTVTTSNSAAPSLELGGISSANLISGAIIDGSGAKKLGLLKSNGSTWTLTSGASNFSGGTSITGGTLVLANSTGSATGSGAVSVAAGGTLAGNGRSSGPLTVSGSISPGTGGIDTLHTGSLSFTTGTYAAQINSTSLSADDVAVTGDLALLGGATLNLSDLGASKMAMNSVLTLLSYSGTYDGGTFTGYANNSQFVLGTNTFKIDYGTGTNSAITLTAVPEPASLAVVGLAGAALLRRRRRA